MTRLNKYVLSNFLRPLTFSYGALIILVMMAELMERLDKFIAGKASVWLVVKYLLALLPVRSVELFPVAALLAALFSLGQLSRRNEITAAMSGGVHPWRLVAPILVTGIFLSIFSWGLGEAVTPWASRTAKQVYNEDIRRLMSRRPSSFAGVTVAGRDVFYSIGRLDVSKQTLENVVIDLTEDGRPVRQLQAARAVWTERGWGLRDGVERIYDGQGTRLSGQRSFKELESGRREKPAELVPQQANPEEMNQRELRLLIDRLKILGIPTKKMEVEYFMKTATPWANLIVLALGVPFAFNKRGGKVKAVGFALGVAFLYFGLMQVGRAMGQKPWSPPLFAAWFANLVFLAAGARLLLRMRRLA